MKKFTYLLLFVLFNTALLQTNAQSNGNCSGNLLTNSGGYYGGFEAGSQNLSGAGGSTDYSYGLPRNGAYEIVSNPRNAGGGGYLSLAPHSGNSQMVLHTRSANNDRIWYKTISVTPGRTYQFCAWIANVKEEPVNGFKINLNINGVAIASKTTAYAWGQVCGTYTAPAGVTSVVLSITDPDAHTGPSHFLSIDDICFSPQTAPPPPAAKVSLGNLVWNDVNGNGLKEADEAGIGGVTLHLFRDADGNNSADGGAIATTTTAANGSYKFSGLDGGKYIVGLIIPSGYTVPPTRFGNPDNNVDNDNNAINVVNNESEVRSNAITLAAGTEPTNDGDDNNSNLTLDLAICGRGDLGDFVWNDRNNNGIQDSGEPGIQGVKVTLTYPDGTTTSKTTDANGKYLFVNLGTGSHKVTFATPAGYNSSPANQGGNDAKDSDPVNGSVTVTMVADQDNFTVDAGFVKPNTPPPPPPTDCPSTTNGSGYYGGFENGGSFPANTGSDLHNGLPRNGSYEIGRSVDEFGGGGYLDIRPRTGNYFMGVHTSNNENDRIWYSKVNVTPGTTYNFCAAVTLLKNLGNGANFIIGVYANGNQIGEGRVTFDWTQICGKYTVPGGVTSVEFSIRDPKKGLFFVAIDDICITPQGPPPPPAEKVALGNLVWNDWDGDGIKEEGEPGVGGVTVRLYRDADGNNQPDGGVIATTTTAANGTYKFSNLEQGKYIVGVVIPEGYTITGTSFPNPDDNRDNDNNGTNVINQAEYRSNHITLAAGTEPTNDGDDNNSNLTLDIGICGRSDIGDFVWHDVDRDGIQDAGEPGIQGVKVTLTYPEGTTRSVTTDANGKYLFVNLGPGTHKVTFETPSGYTPSPSNQGGDDAKDSDPVNGTVTVVVEPVKDNLTIDAGFVKPQAPPPPCPENNLVLGNYVWNDYDGSGTKDIDEYGLAGIAVKLYPDNNNGGIPTGAPIKTRITGQQGFYQFSNLAPGKYIVSITIPEGYLRSPNRLTANTTSPNPDNNVDNDNNLVRPANATTGDEIYTNPITLAHGVEPTFEDGDANTNLTLDLAVCGNLWIGNFVWNDANGNGVQDAGEKGINGARVTIYFPDGITTVTKSTYTWSDPQNPNVDKAGYYDFPRLGPGKYTITFETPQGFTPTAANQGGNDEKDSDAVDGSVTITLPGNASNFTVDAGFKPNGPTPIAPAPSPAPITSAEETGAGMAVERESGNCDLKVSLEAKDPLCYGNRTGSITANVTGNSSKLIYTWSNGSSGSSLMNVAAGKYSLKVKDPATGCEATSETVTLAEPAKLTATLKSASVFCKDGKGNIELDVQGGKGNYTYEWSNGATTQNLQDVSAGKYTVTVKDESKCPVTASITLKEPAQKLVISPAISDITCNDQKGSIDLNVSGGVSPYSVTWNNGSTNKRLNELGSGKYSVTVKDAAGCTVTESYQIKKQGLSVQARSDKSSINAGSGEAVTLEAEVSGGAGNLSYSWTAADGSKLGSKETASVMPSATTDYLVTIKDGSGCTATATVTVNVIAKAEPTKEVSTGVSVEKVRTTPNPSNGNFTVTLNGFQPGKVEVKVMDIGGKEITKKSVNLQGAQTIVPFSLIKVARGVYVVAVVSGDKTFKDKLVIE